MSVLLRTRHHEEAAKQARVMAELALETHPDIQLRTTPGGDPQRLRGIPAIGRNVAGAIPGTKPDNIR